MDERQSAAFLDLSQDLTGFSPFQLRGTGLVETYMGHLRDRAGEGVLADLLSRHADARAASGYDPTALNREIRVTILSDSRLGPVARNLLKLWYVGVWHALPAEWHDAHGGAADDVDCVPTPSAYTEGLLWPAIGANPSGVKPRGYAMWARPPQIPSPRQEG